MFLFETEKMKSKAAVMRLLVNEYFPIGVSRGRWEVLLILSLPQGIEAAVRSPHIVSAGLCSSGKGSSLTLCQCGVTPMADSPAWTSPKWVLPQPPEWSLPWSAVLQKQAAPMWVPPRTQVMSEGSFSISVSQGHSLLQAPSTAAQVFSPP